MTDSFPRQYARTQRFTCGAPRTFRVAADGGRVAFLRSTGGEDSVNALWVLDLDGPDGPRERLVVDPAALLADDTDIPAEERARRERAREAGGGIVSYVSDEGLRTAVIPLNGRLYRVDLDSGEPTALVAQAGAFDPRLDPTGRLVAYVSGADLRATAADGSSGDRLVIGEGRPDQRWGSAEFVAAEEMDRARGFWWAPDGERVLATHVDETPVNQWHIASPIDPASAPTPVRYPAAGTANADVGAAIVGLDGSTVEVMWDRDRFEYVADAGWAPRERPYLVVQSRDQRTLVVLDVDPATGEASEVHRQTDRSWIELVPGVPAFAGNAIVTVADREGARRLELDGSPVTPTDLQVRSVIDVRSTDAGFTATITASTEPTEIDLYRIDVAPDEVDDPSITRLTTGSGVHGGAVGGPTMVLTTASMDTSRVSVHREGDDAVPVTDHRATPSIEPNVTFFEAGDHAVRSALLLPTEHVPGTRLPVLLDPYGGPHAQRVQKARNLFLVSQWFADQGFAVIVADGRGTPARGPEWERSVRGDLAQPVLDDQVTALDAAAQLVADLDLDRVGIRGWSFGGYLAALAVLRRPDRFHAAVAGAPVTDWRLYDTHYTERYLGHPDIEPDNYERTDLTVEAAALTRPLMLIHGLADDNVVAAHTLQLSQALLEAGRPHEVLPLSGVTHMTPQEVVAENLLRLQLDFLRRHLG